MAEPPIDEVGWNPEEYAGRGRLHLEAGRHDDAAFDFEKAIALGLGGAGIFEARGRALRAVGEADDAVDDFTVALSERPDDAGLLYLRGEALRRAGDPAAAVDDLDVALRVDPDLTAAYQVRGDARHALDEEEKAEADWAEYFRRNPDDADFCHSQGHHWQGRDKLEKSRQFFNEAVRIEPRNARHYNCRARVLDAMELHDEAEASREVAARLSGGGDMAEKKLIYPLVEEHFGGIPQERLSLTERRFPFRVGPDLQVALDGLAPSGFVVRHFHATQQHCQPVQDFMQLLQKQRGNPVVAVAPQYQEFDVGDARPVRCLKDGLWLLEWNGTRVGVLLDTRDYQGIRVVAAAAEGAEGQAAAHAFFQRLEDAVRNGACYRGKVLSLEQKEMYSGQQHGILVHRLKAVPREQVILPRPTLDLLDRNVLQFIRQRPKLAELGLATKKGLLFYGPPGTGKTHTIHYLASQLAGQTTFLIAAEQVALIGEYMTLARLFQPSIVVIEDVDLIARERTQMHTPGEEALLNKLLNEMDGLQPEADILFILTTNRPEALETALAARPGRVDQAIEFPLPDAEGRAKLVRLYGQRIEVPGEVVDAVVKKAANVSAAFIKELMRRAAQFYISRDGVGPMRLEDVESALEELLFSGGTLNRTLLGAFGFAPPPG